MKTQLKRKSTSKQNLHILSPRKTETSVKKLQIKKAITSPKNNELKNKKQGGQQLKASTKMATKFHEQLFASHTKQSILFEDNDSITNFVQKIKESEFQNLSKLQMKLLDFVIQKRIIKDDDFDRLYRMMFEKFPKHQNKIKNLLVEILTALDQ